MKGRAARALIPAGWDMGQVLIVLATRREFVMGRDTVDGRYQRADCSRTRADTGLAQICEAVRRTGQTSSLRSGRK